MFPRLTITVLRMLIFCVAWLAPVTADAYIGPGAGISAIGSLLVPIAAVLVAIVGFIWFPMKRLMKNRRKVPSEAVNKGAAVNS